MKELQDEFFLLLKSFEESKILDKFIVIGSWAKEIYMENIPIRRTLIKTLDIDFTLINPKGQYSVSVNDLLRVHEYKPELTIHSKSITYFPASESKKLKIDFLCPFTRNVTEPTNISGLNIVVTPLKYQDILVNNTILLPYKGMSVKVPSPEIWTIHKMAISQLRQGDRLHRLMKSRADLVSTRELVEHFSEEKLNAIVEERFLGKFLKLYQDGMEEFKDMELDMEKDLETGMEF